ncbi:MAG: SHOCT domain-containing protein [Actinomycetes bacterium]
MHLGEVLWAMLVFFIWVMFFMILIQCVMDLFRDPSESGGKKALWVFFMIVALPLAVLIYLIVRGRGMAERNAAAMKGAMQERDAAVNSVVASGATPADQIAKAKELFDGGAISQTEFDALKAKALASA